VNAEARDVAGEGCVLLYDATCGLCSRTVQGILRYDRRGSLRFAAVRSRFGERVLAQHPEVRGIDSVVWVDLTTGLALTRSAASLQVASYLGGAWRLVLVLWLVPRPIRDWGYDLVARHRHLFVQRGAQCFVPAQEVQHRFLDAE
jgi:predicted DCC family thiol-disulfide oxidoreductase YuxK